MKLQEYQEKLKELMNIKFEDLEITEGKTLETFLMYHKISDYEIRLCPIFRKDINRFDYFYNMYIDKDDERVIYRTLNDDTKLLQRVFCVPYVYDKEEDKSYRVPNEILHNDVESDLIISILKGR